MDRDEVREMGRAIDNISRDILTNAQTLGALPNHVVDGIISAIEEHINVQIEARSKLVKAIKIHTDDLAKKCIEECNHNGDDCECVA